VLSSIYGTFNADFSTDAAIRNSWVRDVLEKEKQTAWLQTQVGVKALVAATTGDIETLNKVQEKYWESNFPWYEPEAPKVEAKPLDAVDKATQQFKEALARGKLIDARKEIESELDLGGAWSQVKPKE